ncbi:hypothetical protein BKE30_09805 [Alkanindiges hydrocarboniclasticus]|uniref:Uncharacterized protein n=1 Tax=Alkanindiges hydrocarboniclasticus TaxID=1907941 RepID=A0A1S8CUW2_9GAMM|nr:hypothetical protein [Alkanindiges hydrocarboniclasticus]ONG39313.1 hypothetical protein BKE30_09805 [Alkanindiges hydrocarboniclasticus]
MQQDEKIYAIRHLSFWYTDEWYKSLLDNTDHAGHIAALFNNKEEAIQKWKQLEYEFSHKAKFANIIYCEYSGRDDYGKEAALVQKSVDDLFEIIQELECAVYGLYEYPKNLKQQALFDYQQQKYDDCEINTGDDLKSNIFIAANFIKNNPLNHEVIPPVVDPYDHYVTLKGSLEELSDTPLLLQRLLEENSDIQYEDQNLLKIKFKDLAQINALLKNPIEQEMRYLSIEEIYQLEKQLNLTDPESI